MEEKDKIEVAIPSPQAGEITVLSKSAFKNPAPDKLKRVLSGIRYTLVAIMGTVAASDLFDGRQAKIITFCLCVAIGICGGIELSVGVKPLPDDSK